MSKSMKYKKRKTIYLLLPSVLLCWASLVHAAKDDAMTSALPPCVDPPIGIRVLGGDTLSEISQRMMKPGMRLNEWVNSVYESNPHAFIGKDKNRLREHAVLVLPCADNTSVSEDATSSVVDPAIDNFDATMQEIKTELAAIKRLVVDQSKTQNTQPQSPGFSTTAVLGMAVLIVLLLAALSVYLYKWRRAMSVTAGQTLPELETIKQLLRGIGVNTKTAGPGVSDSGAEEGASDVSDLRDYLKRLIPVDIAVDDFMQDGEASKALEVVKALIEDALDSCGVETFSPGIGEDYRRAEGVADYPKTQVTDKPEDKFKIVEVLEKGYRIKTETGYDVIYPARVRILNTN